MESPKPNHANMKSNVHLVKIEGGKYGLLGFNNMLPAKNEHLVEFDIDAESDPAYRELLKNQLRFCRSNSENICSHAAKTYEAVVSKKIPFFLKICCDFKRLEDESQNYG